MLPNAWIAANAAAHLQLRVYALAQQLAAVHAEEQPRPHEELQSTVPPVSSNPPSTGTVAAASPPETQPGTGGIYACIGSAETGLDYTMHGSTYSTAFGLVNEIVTDYASPEVAARVFSGTATASEELDIVVRFTNDHGFGGFGYLTRQKCGL